MLKMLSHSIHFISNNVASIQTIKKKINFFEYLKKAIASCGFIFLQETSSTIHDENMQRQVLRKTFFLTWSKKFL